MNRKGGCVRSRRVCCSAHWKRGLPIGRLDSYAKMQVGEIEVGIVGPQTSGLFSFPNSSRPNVQSHASTHLFVIEAYFRFEEFQYLREISF